MPLTPLLVLACATTSTIAPPPAPEPPPPPPAPTLSEVIADATVVDLSHALGPEIPYFPGGVPFTSETLATVEGDGYYVNRFTTGEHTGTHVDAPAHFVAGQPSMEQVPAAQLVGPAAVIDIADAVAADPDALLQPEHVAAWEAAHGALTDGHIVLVHTGWASRWPDIDAYRNIGDDETMHFPGVSVAASELLIERGVRCIGVDTLSTDPGNSGDFAQHVHFLGAAGYHIENLANLDQLPPAGAVVFVGALPIVGGSGAPARVLALVP